MKKNPSPTRWNREHKMLEKQCGKCGEWLPATQEFFYCSRGSLRSPCKACIAEQRQETNRDAICCVPGCNQPRRVSRNGVRHYSRCDEHQHEIEAVRYHRQKGAI